MMDTNGELRHTVIWTATIAVSDGKIQFIFHSPSVHVVPKYLSIAAKCASSISRRNRTTATTAAAFVAVAAAVSSFSPAAAAAASHLLMANPI